MRRHMKNKAHTTAIKRKRHSVPMRWLLKNGYVSSEMNGLDYGCGLGFDADTLGFASYDPYYRPEMPTGKFDLVTSVYMMNVIEDADERLEAEDNIINFLSEGGKAYLAVRNDKCALNGCTSKGTWQGSVEPVRSGWELIVSNARFKIWEYTKH
jgi:hypothetical protein